jgi:hypothetical protein
MPGWAGARRAVYALVLSSQGFTIEHLGVVAKGSNEILEEHLPTRKALTLSSKGQQPVRWELAF